MSTKKNSMNFEVSFLIFSLFLVFSSERIFSVSYFSELVLRVVLFHFRPLCYVLTILTGDHSEPVWQRQVCSETFLLSILSLGIQVPERLILRDCSDQPPWSHLSENVLFYSFFPILTKNQELLKRIVAKLL